MFIREAEKERYMERAREASSVNFTPTAAKGHWSNCCYVPDLRVRMKSEVEDTNKKSM